MHPRSPPNSSWLLSYCLLSACWRAILGPCRRSRWSFSVHLKVNNSATKTSLAMISDAYESPSHRLSHAVPLVSRFKVKYVPVQIFPPFMKTSKLPVHSTLYNSATRTSLAMILDSYESPTSGLSYAVPYVRRLGKKYISVQFFPPVQFFPLLGSWDNQKPNQLEVQVQTKMSGEPLAENKGGEDVAGCGQPADFSRVRSPVRARCPRRVFPALRAARMRPGP